MLILRALSLVITAFAAEPTACQIHVTSLVGGSFNWSAACTPITTDGVVVAINTQIGEMLSNMSQMQILVDINGQRMTSARVFGVDIQNDLLLFKTEATFSEGAITRPFERKVAMLLLDARMPELFAEDGPKLQLGHWQLPRPGIAFSCSQSHECVANLGIPVDDKADAGTLKIKHFGYVIAGAFSAAHYNQLGLAFESASFQKLSPKQDPVECDHQVVVGKKGTKVKVDYCLSRYRANQGFFNGTVKIATLEKSPSAVVVALDFTGFSSAMIKKVTGRYINTLDSN